jgi:hypothetical protein
MEEYSRMEEKDYREKGTRKAGSAGMFGILVSWVHHDGTRLILVIPGIKLAVLIKGLMPFLLLNQSYLLVASRAPRVTSHSAVWTTLLSPGLNCNQTCSPTCRKVANHSP